MLRDIFRMSLLRNLLLLCAAAMIAGCGGGSSTPGNENAAAVTTVTVYSPHGAHLEGDIKKRFEAAYPQYKVEFLDMGGAKILARLQAEKARPHADVWWGGSPSDFRRGEAQGLLTPYTPAWSEAVPPEGRSATGAWFATFRTPEVIMYNKDKVKREDVPTTWEGLLDPKWKGRIVVRDVRPSATMKTIFGALIAREIKRGGGVEAGYAFLKKLDENTGAYAAEPQVMYDLLKDPGPYAITPWSFADAPLLMSRGYPFDYVLPKETPVLYDAIALVKGGPNPEGAKVFYDFVNTPEQLILMAHERSRLPARGDLPPEKLPKWLTELKIEPMDIDWALFDKNIDEWIAHWDAKIKTKK
ncbi:MAG TPA: extracellular solute-binding protein [Planctomycetota bacterium]|nr:extracellular solute-binding protein [Planctomycetota bacterium]